MKQKIWLSVACGLLVVGALLFTVAMAAVDFHWDILETASYALHTHTVEEDFRDIRIRVETADVSFVPTDGVCKVESYESENLHHEVIVMDDTLLIQVVDERRWYDFLGISFHSPEITVHLPREAYQSLSLTTQTGEVLLPAGIAFHTAEVSGTTCSVDCASPIADTLDIRTTTGEILVRGQEAASIRLSCGTGDVRVEDSHCGVDLQVETSTGSVTLQRLTVFHKLTAICSTGDVTLEDCDAGELHIRTGTGSVRGSLRSGKTFRVETGTGDIRIPADSAGGGLCEIETGTGDVTIEVK